MKQLKTCSEQTCTHSIIRTDGIGSRQGLVDQILYFSLSLTGLACSTLHCQYSTWNEQVERDQSSLSSSSSSDWIFLLCTQKLPHRSDRSLLFEALCCKCWFLCSRGNSRYGSARGPCNVFEDLQESLIDNFTDVERHKCIGFIITVPWPGHYLQQISSVKRSGTLEMLINGSLACMITIENQYFSVSGHWKRKCQNIEKYVVWHIESISRNHPSISPLILLFPCGRGHGGTKSLLWWLPVIGAARSPWVHQRWNGSSTGYHSAAQSSSTSINHVILTQGCTIFEHAIGLRMIKPLSCWDLKSLERLKRLS